MLAILALAGLGLGLTALLLDDGDDDAAPAGSRTTSDDDDFVYDEGFRPGVVEGLDDLVQEGEMTRAEANALLRDLVFVSGEQNLDTGKGDDGVVLLRGDNNIDTGEGDDTVLAGTGSDFVNLGAGDDVYGADTRVIYQVDDTKTFPDPDESLPVGGNAVRGDDLDRGDDTIAGGAGDDAISDNFGSNLINGQQGDDFIIAVDDRSDLGTADTVKGGIGRDTLVVDEGDLVTTGAGADQVILETYSGVADGYDMITVTDFGERDLLVLQGRAELLRPGGPGTDSPISLQELPETGTLVLVNGIPVANLAGAQGVSYSQLQMRIIEN
ncbi:hypothetical protein KBY28_14190 [Ruegeria pomeroyi]|uniref:hypothetical protein n=1 Tax=Ruegeria pomeroyi TaxID=89184 RepID=UPI001F422552|nr:hypothetical protein [Ruegeria pomeroyi]MCE8509594.1 hypothetical protein [Ruegeria pomeroyi]